MCKRVDFARKANNPIGWLKKDNGFFYTDDELIEVLALLQRFKSKDITALGRGIILPSTWLDRVRVFLQSEQEIQESVGSMMRVISAPAYKHQTHKFIKLHLSCYPPQKRQAILLLHVHDKGCLLDWLSKDSVMIGHTCNMMRQLLPEDCAYKITQMAIVTMLAQTDEIDFVVYVTSIPLSLFKELLLCKTTSNIPFFQVLIEQPQKTKLLEQAFESIFEAQQLNSKAKPRPILTQYSLQNKEELAELTKGCEKMTLAEITKKSTSPS